MLAEMNTKVDDTNAIPVCRYAGVQKETGDHPGKYVAFCDKFEPVVTDIGKLVLKFYG